MNLVKCENGHFYDTNRYDTCPHCESGGIRNDNMTVPVIHGGGDAVTTDFASVPAGSSSDVTASIAAPSLGSSLQEAVKSAAAGGASPIGGADEKTVGFYKRAIGTEPVVGWLVCVSGEHFGEDFRLKSGRNFIGRGSGMDVVIAKDSAVSREKHSVVVYEPKANTFLVMPGESSELSYLGDEVVLTPKQLKVNDVLTVGDTKLMFIPCCSSAFSWDSEKKEGK